MQRHDETGRMSSAIHATALAAALLGGMIVAAAPAFAQDPTRSWSEEKCVRYKKAWTEALARRGAKGLGPAFVERHDAFVASGCTTTPDVCPRSSEELDLANIMVIAAMNAGTASTFLPFACRK